MDTEAVKQQQYASARRYGCAKDTVLPHADATPHYRPRSIPIGLLVLEALTSAIGISGCAMRLVHPKKTGPLLLFFQEASPNEVSRLAHSHAEYFGFPKLLLLSLSNRDHDYPPLPQSSKLSFVCHYGILCSYAPL